MTSGDQRHRASSSPNVASSSWAIQPALRPQPQSRQYVISIDGLFGMGSDASRDGRRDAKTSTIVPFEILCEAAHEPKTPSIPLDAMRRRGKPAPPRKSVENRKPKNRRTLLRCKTEPAMLAPRPSGAQRSYAARGRPALAPPYIRTERRHHGSSSASSISCWMRLV